MQKQETRGRSSGLNEAIKVAVFHPFPINVLGYKTILEREGIVCNDPLRTDKKPTSHSLQNTDVCIIHRRKKDDIFENVMPLLDACSPSPRRIITTTHQETMVGIHDLLKSGIHGYLLEASEPQEIIAAVRKVAAGKLYLPPRITDEYLRGQTAGVEYDIHSLSPREHEMMQHIAEGTLRNEIAEKMGIARKTVESYRENIKVKLGLPDSIELMKTAVRWHFSQNGNGSHKKNGAGNHFI